MNITILANRDLPSHLALSRLLPGLRGAHNVSLFFSSKVGGKQVLAEPLEELGRFEKQLLSQADIPDVPANVATLDAINSEEGGGKTARD